MQTKVLNISELNINKHSGKPKSQCIKSTTILVRYRWQILIKNIPQHQPQKGWCFFTSKISKVIISK